jgi:hypothetical protein
MMEHWIDLISGWGESMGLRAWLLQGKWTAAQPVSKEPAAPTTPPEGRQRRMKDEQTRLWIETWFRGSALMLVVIAVVVYPMYALIVHIPSSTLAQVIAPITGIAGAVIGYWFGQASRRTQDAFEPRGND